MFELKPKLSEARNILVGIMPNKMRHDSASPIYAQHLAEFHNDISSAINLVIEQIQDIENRLDKMPPS